MASSIIKWALLFLFCVTPVYAEMATSANYTVYFVIKPAISSNNTTMIINPTAQNDTKGHLYAIPAITVPPYTSGAGDVYKEIKKAPVEEIPEVVGKVFLKSILPLLMIGILIFLHRRHKRKQEIEALEEEGGVVGAVDEEKKNYY